MSFLRAFFLFLSDSIFIIHQLFSLILFPKPFNFQEHLILTMQVPWIFMLMAMSQHCLEQIVSDYPACCFWTVSPCFPIISFLILQILQIEHAYNINQCIYPYMYIEIYYICTNIYYIY